MFKQVIVASETITEQYLQSRIMELKNSVSGETPRGLLIYAYCSGDSREEIKRLCAAYKKSNTAHMPIVILLLDDVDKEIIAPLITIKAMAKFSRADTERFSKHIASQQKACTKKIIVAFNRLANKREMITEDGVVTYSDRRNQLCSAKFEELYKRTPPFAFDGFEKKTSSQAKKYLANICRKMFDKTMLNVQGYQALTQEEKNRVKACLSTGTRTSWRVFADSCALIDPQNEIIKEIIDDIFANLSFDKQITFHTLFGKYLEPPYGMNANALALLCIYFLTHKGNQVLCYYGSEKLMPSHLSDKVFRQDSLNFTELKKLNFRKNPNAEIDVVAEKSKEALQCTLVSKCAALRKSLDTLIAQEGTTPSNQLLVADAKAHLDMGIKLHDKQNDELAQLKVLIEEAKTSFKLQKFTRTAFQYSFSPSGLIDPEYSFVYEDAYKEQLAKYRSEIDKLLRAKYLPTLARFTCLITQLSSVKASFSKVSSLLRDNGYSDLAEATDRRISEVETELLVKQKYETSFVELEKDIAMCENVSQYNFSSAQVMLSKLENWQSFINSAKDLPPKMAEQYVARIKSAEDRLWKQIQDLQATVTSVISSVINAQSLQELSHGEERLGALSSLEPPENTLADISTLRENIQKARAVVESLPSQIDALSEFTPTGGTMFVEVIKAELQQKLTGLIGLQSAWVKQFIEIAEKEIDTMTAASCSRWLNQTQTLPDYLSRDVICRYQATRERVEHRLHSCRVQGVISLFDELSRDEKAECLRLLNKREAK